MNSILEKEPVKRAEKALKNFDDKLNILVLQQTARTATDAAAALGCSVGAIVKSLVFKVEEDFIHLSRKRKFLIVLEILNF